MKHHIKLPLLMLSIALLSVSCIATKNQYGIANIATGSDLSFKPAYRDTVETATYVGGSFSSTTGRNGYNEGESSHFGLINFNRAVTFKNFNASYGGFLYGGKYRTQEFAGIPMRNQSFLGGGFTGDINFNIPVNNLDLRFIGLKATYLRETGDYFDFRNTVDGRRLADNLNPDRGTFRLNLTSELIVKINEEMEAGGGLSLGLNKGAHSGAGFFFTRKRLSLYYLHTYRFTQVFDYSLNNDEFQMSLNTIGFAFRIK